LASDGNWYPQRWEYHSINTGGSPYTEDAAKALAQAAAKLGQLGWEMLNYTMHHYNRRSTLTEWFATAVFKRPLKP
jgi:hypothetical protein